MTQPAPQTLFVVLSDEDSAGRIVVDLDAYARFRVQMERNFAELEAKWGHLAPRRLLLTPDSRGVSPSPRKPK